MNLQDNIIIEFHAGEHVKKDGVGKKSGKPYEMTIQTGYVTMPGRRYPEEIEVVHFGDEKPYSPGKYKLDVAHSLYVNDKKVMLGKLQLVPLAATQAAAPQAKAS